jgi:hypothetical protein
MGANYNRNINSNINTNTNTSHSKRMHNTLIKFLQINLQHSRAATNNLLKTIEEDDIDVICIQEPYVINNKVVGIPRKYKILAYGEGKHTAAIVITNKIIDSILIRQLSDEDAVVTKVMYNKVKIIIASMYFDINRQREDDLNKIEAIMQHAKGTGTIIAMDSNARSTTWQDHITNHRRRILEELFVSVQLHILNEDSNLTTYLSNRGSSKFDLTVTGNSILIAVEEWEVSNQESCSDHSIIRFAIRQASYQRSTHDHREVRYIIRREDIAKFQENLTTSLEGKHGSTSSEGETEELDSIMSNIGRECENIEQKLTIFTKK